MYPPLLAIILVLALAVSSSSYASDDELVHQKFAERLSAAVDQRARSFVVDELARQTREIEARSTRTLEHIYDEALAANAASAEAPPHYTITIRDEHVPCAGAGNVSPCWLAADTTPAALPASPAPR